MIWIFIHRLDFLILRTFNDMGNQPGILIGTKDTPRRVNLPPIYQALQQDRAEAIPFSMLSQDLIQQAI